MEPLTARILIIPAALGLWLAGTPGAGAATPNRSTTGRTTTQQTLVPERAPKSNGKKSHFHFLKEAPGEKYRVRGTKSDLARAKRGRAKRRKSLLYFAQLSDFQLADPESPVRVETLYGLSRNFVGAWRPHETLMPHLIDASIRQVNQFVRSPVKQAKNRRARMKLALLTGDNIDNQQRNEAEWMAQLIDGGEVKRDAHAPTGTSASATCPVSHAGAIHTNGYNGVQRYRGPAKLPPFYNPDHPEGPYSAWPQYPGLLDRAKRPFVAAGLKVPSYVVLGNHDGLLQGNARANPIFGAFAEGCVKPLSLIMPDGSQSAEELARHLGSDPTKAMLIKADSKRQLITKEEYKAILASGQKDAHGFGLVDKKELKASHGAASYYAWNPVRGVRIIALDTISEAGVVGVSHEGNVDHPQYKWLVRELRRATRKNELVVVSSHHGPESLSANVPDEKAARCTTPPGKRDANPGCKRDPRTSRPLHLGKSMTKLLLKFPNVVSWVSGHTHVNAVTPFKSGKGAFWGIRTSSEADWPHQSRLIEIMDNRDGTLSIFGTMLNDSSPVKAPHSGTMAGKLSDSDLASIARTLGYNTHRGGGASGGPGKHGDRNVELVIRDPRR